jgi:6-phosphogluconolactonase
MSSVINGYIGTYTQGRGGKGIYRFTMDSASGCIEDLRLAAPAVNPSWLAVRGQTLYAALEVNDYQGGGAVAAYRVETDGGLSPINQKPTGGGSPCHLAIDGTGAYLVAANYSGRNIAVFPLEKGEKNGALGDAAQIIPFSGSGPNRERQEGPHPHSFLFDTECAFGFALDLGADRITAFRFAPGGPEPLEAAGVPCYEGRPGAGPRHGVFNAEGNAAGGVAGTVAAGGVAYIINELDSTLDVLRYDPRLGKLERIQSLSTLPAGCSVASTCAAVRISPDGRRVYASNRGHDSIAIFAVREDGTLAFVRAELSGGKTPRDFNLAPGGRFLVAANQDSDNFSVFAVDSGSPSLRKIREYALPSPVCVLFCPACRRGEVVK